MNQATWIYFERMKTLFTKCGSQRDACNLLIDVVLYTSFTKKQREVLVELFKEKSGFKYFCCHDCAESFINQTDLDAHFFNNNYCGKQ